eukprot:GFYU01011193.1.p1 GENE.GFYU01011193.1~~GFYU01011193.1.p1  ORF type:complete len:338 (-),score=30.93 GFYU01011193.1:231-1244(-)
MNTMGTLRYRRNCIIFCVYIALCCWAGCSRAQTAPAITTFRAVNSDGKGGLGAGDVIEVLFDMATNKPGPGVNNKISKETFDIMFQVSSALGVNYEGNWSTAGDQLNITISNPSISDVRVGTTTLTVLPASQLQATGSVGPVSTAVSPPLSGSFGAAPQVVSVVGSGNELTVTFDIPTSKPLTTPGSFLNALFTLSPTGTVFQSDDVGKWNADGSVLVITLTKPGDFITGTTVFTVKQASGVRDVHGTTDASVSVSPALSGTLATSTTTTDGGGTKGNLGAEWLTDEIMILGGSIIGLIVLSIILVVVVISVKRNKARRSAGDHELVRVSPGHAAVR